MKQKLACDRGNATILVTVIGAISLIVAFKQFDALVIERQAIEDNLLEVRAYWAAKGQLNYVLSRTFFAGGCNSSCGNGNSDVTTLPTAYLQDIACYTDWSYPELNNYQFTVTPTISNDPNAPGGHIAEVLLRATFTAAGSTLPSACSPATGTQPPAMQAITRIRPIEFRYCLAATAGTACGNHPTGSTPGYQHITTVLRPSS
jgi:hypothetical protein